MKFILYFSIFLIGCSSAPHKIQKDSLFTKAGMLDGLECLNKDHYNLELSCHRLNKGKNIVVGVREFHKSESGHSDRFRKFTLFLNEGIKLGEKYAIDGRVDAFLSYGLTYGPGKVGCYGRADSGTAEVIDFTEDKIIVKVNVHFFMKSPLEWEGNCGSEI